MSSFPLFSSVSVGRPVFAMQSAASLKKSSGETLLATSLPKLANVVPASRLGVRPAPELVSSGICQIDALTGGLARGCLTEIYGPASSGRTSILLAALAAATQRQEACALVDVSDSFDPVSAAAAAVNFEKLLWIRCGVNEKHGRGWEGHNFSRATSTSVRTRALATEGKKRNSSEAPVEKALRATDLLLQSGGFGLVIIDLGDVPFKTARRIPLTSWFRFQRAVEHTQTVLLVITQAPCAQTCAALLLKVQVRSLVGRGSLAKKPSANSSQSPAQQNALDGSVEGHFSSRTELLEGFHVNAEILRSRLQRKPSGSIRAEFVTKAVRAG